jgi:hypothetical protein
LIAATSSEVVSIGRRRMIELAMPLALRSSPKRRSTSAMREAGHSLTTSRAESS